MTITRSQLLPIATLLTESKLPVLVDFAAEWCAPCRALEPVTDAVAEERAGSVEVARLGVDSDPHAASQYGVRSLPTLVLFECATEISRLVGAHPKHVIDRWLDRELTGRSASAAGVPPGVMQ